MCKQGTIINFCKNNTKIFRNRRKLIQNRGACAFKLSSIKFFNWIIQNNYQNIVKMCIPAHDEFLIECPENMAELVLDIITKCMVAGGKPFCKNVYLGADGGIYDHWVH